MSRRLCEGVGALMRAEGGRVLCPKCSRSFDTSKMRPAPAISWRPIPRHFAAPPAPVSAPAQGEGEGND